MFPSSLPPIPAPPSPLLAWPTFESVELLDSRFRQERDHAQLVLGHSASTIRWLRDGYRNLRRFLGGDCAPMPVVLAPAILEAWVAWNRASGVSGHTLRTYFASVKRAVGAITTRDGTANPFQHVRAPGVPQH